MDSIPLVAMRLVFRADASPKIGTGHVMRSSALAEAAIEQGIECVFVGGLGGIPWLESHMREVGFTAILDNDLTFFPDRNEDVLILDSYLIDPRDSFIQRRNWFRVINIADVLTPEYECDLIIHPGLDIDWLSSRNIPVLAGADFVLTRKSIKKVSPPLVSKILGPRVLVVGGGSDPFRFCDAISKVLETFTFSFEADFFTNSPILSNSGKTFRSHAIGSALNELVKFADLVLTTASTTSLEFIGREIPTGVACVVKNQENYYVELGNLGIAQLIGTHTANGVWNLDRDAIYELITSPELRTKFHVRSANLIDLRGAERVVDYITENYS